MWMLQPAILVYHQESHPFLESCVSSFGLTTWCVRTVGESPLSAWVSQQMIWRMWDLKILCHWRRFSKTTGLKRQIFWGFPLRRLEDVIFFDSFLYVKHYYVFFDVFVCCINSVMWLMFCRHATVLLFVHVTDSFVTYVHVAYVHCWHCCNAK